MKVSGAWMWVLLVWAVPTQAQVYKHVDPRGGVTYSSSPPAGGSSAVEVKIHKRSPEQEAMAHEERARFLERERTRRLREAQLALAQKKSVMT